MFLKSLDALRRLGRAAENAARRAVVWAPLLAAVLGGAVPARAGSSALLNINVTFQAIGSIPDLTAVPGASTGTISLSWTEPYHTAGVAPYSYDVRASSMVQISDDAAFVAALPLSAFSPSVPPAPGSGGGAAGFVVTGLTPTVTYYFAIREKDSTTFHGSWTRSGSQNAVNFAVATSSRPAAPAGVAISSVSSGSVSAAWSVSSGATDYVLIASTASDNPPTLIAGSSTTLSTAATVSGLGPNATYFLFVAACGGGCSAYAAAGSTVTLAAPASGLAATAVSTTSVTLAWNAGGNPAGTTFVVQDSTDGVSFSSAAATVSTGAAVSGLANNATYYFRVVAQNSAGAPSAPSNVISVLTGLGAPPAPTGAHLVGVSASSATIAWTVSAGATGYVLIASTSAANPPSPIAASTAATSSTATLTGLGPNATYFFLVAACGEGCSPFASAGSTITPAAPATGLSALAVSSSAVTLLWSPAGNPSGTVFLVEVSTDGVVFSSAAAATSPSASVTGLTAGTAYSFRVTATNFAGARSAPSNVLSVVTTPAAPAAGGAIAVGESSLTAAWSVASGATGYVLIASTTPAVPPSSVAASSVTASSTATLAGLGPNATYFLSVSACGTGCSPFAALGSTITLAAPAVSLSTTAISSNTLTLAWDANGNPAGTLYLVQRSTDASAYATAGSAAAPAISFTGLTSGVTYYFRVVSVNGAGVPSAPSAALAVLMPFTPPPATPANFAAARGLLSVTLTWDAVPAGQQGLGLQDYRLMRSASASSGFVQIATTTGTSFLDRPLAAGATVYYKIAAHDVGGNDSAFSLAVSAVPYTEAPMEPLGVQIQTSSTAVSLSWSPTTRFFDGTPFLSTATPSADELQGYAVYRSTDISAPDYVRVSSLPISATSLTDHTGGLSYYYRLLAFNTAGVSSNVVTLSSLGERNFMMDDGVSRMVVDPETSANFAKAANGVGDIRIMNQRRPEDVGNGTFQSMKWTAFMNGVSEIKDFVLPKPARMVLGFDVQGGVPVPSTAAIGGASARSVRSAGAANVQNLGVYWYNGAQYVKMYGKIDPVGQTVSVESPNLGVYQIRALARAGGAVFDVSNLSSRVITPNGDGLNDTLIFTYDPGPRNVQPEGKIFDLRGAFVADMTPGLVPNTLTWDGRMNGRPATSGVYVYRITGDGKTFTGSIVVAR